MGRAGKYDSCTCADDLNPAASPYLYLRDLWDEMEFPDYVLRVHAYANAKSAYQAYSTNWDVFG